MCILPVVPMLNRDRETKALYLPPSYAKNINKRLFVQVTSTLSSLLLVLQELTGTCGLMFAMVSTATFFFGGHNHDDNADAFNAIVQSIPTFGFSSNSKLVVSRGGGRFDAKKSLNGTSSSGRVPTLRETPTCAP